MGVDSAAVRGDGVVVAGSAQSDPDEEDSPAVWRSTDRGVTWSRVGDPDLGSGGSVDNVVAGPTAFVAIGSVDARGEPSVTALWFSADGEDW